MAPVTYIPSQTADESAFTSNRASVSSPWKLFFHDAIILFHNLRYVFNVILPLRIPAHRHGVRYHLAPIVANETLLALSIAYEVGLLVAGCVAILVLPGLAFVLCFVVTTGIVVLLAAPGWGGRTVQSRNARVTSNRFPHEKWIFMNGVAQSHMDLQFTVDNLSATFQRPFLGIHNRSLGFVWDIGECLFQRCMGYSSEDVRICYDELKIPLLDPTITKVVVIAHSQGGIILSLTIDRMFAELSPVAMSKLEIYTFGSAAAHFNNPLRYSSYVDQNLRLRDPMEDHIHRRHRHIVPRRREEQLPPLEKPGQDPLQAEGPPRTQRIPQILDQPIINSPPRSPPLDPNLEKLEKVVALEAAVDAQQAPDVVHPMADGGPFGASSSNHDVENLEEVTPPIQISQTPQKAAIQEPINLSSPFRPSSPRVSVGKSAKAVVDLANVDSRSFVGTSSSENGGIPIQQSQPIGTKKGSETKRERTKPIPPINSKHGAYDGIHHGRVQFSPQDERTGYTNEGTEHIITVIEHYCNEFDMVPRWGVLNNVRYQPQHRYAGSVFIHRQASGHLFNRHYLDTMFPMDRKAQHFLDQVVDVDIRTAKARAGALASSVTSTAEVEPESRAWLLYDSVTELISPSTLFARILAFILYVRLSSTSAFWSGVPSLGQTARVMREGVDLIAKEETGIDLDHATDEDRVGEKTTALPETTESAQVAAEIQESKGKPVRQLSKLWKYMYGGVA